MEEELDELKREHLKNDLKTFEDAMEEFDEQLWFRDLESVSAEYEELEIPTWLTEAKGQQIITEMELYEQKEWVKIIRD